MSTVVEPDEVTCDCCGADMESRHGETLAQLGVAFRDPTRRGVLCPTCAMALLWIGPTLKHLDDELLKLMWPHDVVAITSYLQRVLYEYFADRLLPHLPDEMPSGRSQRIRSEIERALQESSESERGGDA